MSGPPGRKMSMNGTEPRKHTISVLVENKFGVLSRVAGLFSARGYNIESLSVGETLDPTVSRMTLVVGGDEFVIEQVMKQLHKLIDVIKVNDLTDESHVERELMLIRVNAEPQHREEILRTADIFRAKVVDVTQVSFVLEATGDEGKLEALIELLRPMGIQEIVRTGKVAPVADAAKAGDVVMILLPDQTQRSVFEESIRKGLGKGKMLMFAHGFNIHFNQVVPPPDVDVTMIAPKAPGHVMRDLFTQGPGVPALVAVQQDVTGKARDLALAYGRGVGCTRAGVIETTFKEETETDLFGEQTTLCGGVSHLIKAAFETLVEAGYQPEVAYFECMHEMKLIVDLFYQGGLAYMRYSVSDTAEYGDYTRGPRVVSEETKREMKKILSEIQTGQFAREWILENQANRAQFLAMRKRDADHKIEEVGQRLGAMMSWIKPPRM